MIVRPDGSLLGTFTDGDLRRVFERVAEPRTLDAETAHAKSRRPSASPPVPISTIQPAHPAIDCLRIMRDSQITSLVVTDTAGRPIGLLRLLDLLKAGLS